MDESSSKVVGFPVKKDDEFSAKKDDKQHSGDDRLKLLFEWAEHALEASGLLKLLRDAKTLSELDAIKFEPGNLTLVVLIRDALHSGSSGKARAKHFQHLTEKHLENILRARFNHYIKEQRKKLIAGEQQTAAERSA